MVSLTKTPKQGLLFSEPFYSETGVWCELSLGIEPEEWASLCRHIGNLSPKEFKKAQKKVYESPDSLLKRLRRLFIFEHSNLAGMPVLSLGPSGIGGEFQREE